MILFVDDERDVRTVVQRLLMHHGYPSAGAEDVPGAFEVLQTESVALVILDWMMPGRGGADFLRDLAEDPEQRHVPVVVYTAAPVDDVRPVAVSLGARAVVSKGEPFDVLLARVGEFVGPARRRQGA